MEGVLVKRLMSQNNIVGLAIVMLIFTQSIPIVTAGNRYANTERVINCGRYGVMPENCDDVRNAHLKNREEHHVSSATDLSSGEISDTLPRAEFAALINKKDTSQYSPQDPETIYFAASEFLDTVRNENMLEQFLRKGEDHSQRLDFANMHTFMMYILERLPSFRTLFEKLAGEYDLDWRLLAAIAYQESHWNPEAVSPTGVRGLMMLTRDTARYVGVTNRTDPEQSVRGGARYFKIVKKKLPERIPEPDRSWLALASYNVGFGHLEDARILTQRSGGNPDNWQDVKKRLPLLSVKKWHSRTKHGYARGHEPVKYVQNIRNYYSILKLLTRETVWSTRADAGSALPDS